MGFPVTIAIATPETSPEVTAACVRSLIGAEIRLVPWRGSYASTINHGLAGATTRFVAIANNDIEAPPEWPKMLDHLTTGAGIICPLEYQKPVYFPDGELVEGVQGFFGGFFIMPTVLWNQVGGFDEQFTPYYCEDTDLLKTLETEGYRILQDHRIAFKHLQNHTVKHDPERDYHLAANRARFMEKWGVDPITYQH